MLQYSLYHRITYWLRTCTPEETEEMAELVDAAILEVVHAATGIRFDAERVCEGQSEATGPTKGVRNKKHGGHPLTGLSWSAPQRDAEMHRQKGTQWREARRHIQ